jgi:hypothetical protein
MDTTYAVSCERCDVIIGRVGFTLETGYETRKEKGLLPLAKC